MENIHSLKDVKVKKDDNKCIEYFEKMLEMSKSGEIKSFVGVIETDKGEFHMTQSRSVDPDRVAMELFRMFCSRLGLSFGG